MAKGSKQARFGIYDMKLLFPVIFLAGIGIVMVYSASSALALKKYGSDYYFLKRQALFALAGMAILIACKHIPYRWYRAMVYPLLGISLALLVAIQVSGFGISAGGSVRWLRLGGFTIQPSELARFSMIIFMAYSMSKKNEQMKEFTIGFIPHVIVLGLFTVLIAVQPDFGSVVILFAITWIMLFVGGARILHLLSVMALILPAGYFFMINAEYRVKRLMSFLDPWQYPADEGYQIVHSLMAFGSGGIVGTGLGNSYQKLFYLPEPHTDFIFSVIGEELGLIGVILILGLYALIIWRGIMISKKVTDIFGKYVAIGLTTALGLQVCINMGVTLGLLPTKGLTLPFLSYGGSSLLISMASIGVLMNIAGSVQK
ncbi:MAG: putative lipid II flippase FtsW [Desulfobacterales bacterium]|nr:putative lipid II flippase FtsW [Desulfobacterales bacterium]